MARLLKQRYTAKDDQGRKVTRKSKKWYVEYRDGQGIRRRVPGFTDEVATQQLASELERKAQREQSGLVDRFADHRKRPLSGHVVDWHKALLDKGATQTYANLSKNRVTAILDGTKARF